MGNKTADRIWPTWVQTVGALRAEGASVRAYCPRCQTTLIVDLDVICHMRGRSFSLIDRTSTCKVYGCGGKAWFLVARPQSSTPTIRLWNRTTPDP